MNNGNPIYSSDDISELILNSGDDLDMGLEYDKRIYAEKHSHFDQTCSACKKQIKVGEIVELLMIGGNKAWFHEDCMLPYITKIKREFLLSKI